MAAPVTAKYEDLVLEIETSTPGTYAKICGGMGFSYSKTAQVDRVEVPADCDDESLPYAVEKQVRSTEYVIEATMTWSTMNHELLADWFDGGAIKNIRIRYVMADVGDTEYESGPALLTKNDWNRDKGKKITGVVTIEFDGKPVRTAKP